MGWVPVSAMFFTMRSAVATGSRFGRKNWYAPRTTPAFFMPGQLLFHVESPSSRLEVYRRNLSYKLGSDGTFSMSRSLAIKRAMIVSSQMGTSGLISRNGR